MHYIRTMCQVAIENAEHVVNFAWFHSIVVLLEYLCHSRNNECNIPRFDCQLFVNFVVGAITLQTFIMNNIAFSIIADNFHRHTIF